MGPEPRDYLDNNEYTSNEDNHETGEDQIENEYAKRSYSSIADEIINLDVPGSDGLGSGKQLQYKL